MRAARILSALALALSLAALGGLAWIASSQERRIASLERDRAQTTVEALAGPQPDAPLTLDEYHSVRD